MIVLGKFSAELIACQRCGHEWFNAPEAWLGQAYTTPIANTDTGIVSRTLNIHKIISSYLTLSGISGKLLDWGSGSGLLTRLLRDDGHDCYGFEPYADPVLASRFTFTTQRLASSEGPYRAIFAIEVVEHLVSPRDFFITSLSLTDTIIFSTKIVNRTRYGSDWWYYSRETGQHISFYTQKSLAYLSGLSGCCYASSINMDLHIVTRNPLDLLLFRLLSGSKRALVSYPLARIIGKLSGRRTLMIKDHLAATQALRFAQDSISE
jgi:hypothetical protein